MAMIVRKLFRHVNTGRIWHVGDVFEGTEAQAAELARKGYLDGACGQAAAEGLLGESREGSAEGPPADLDDLTVKQLVAICVERKIETPSKPRKPELVAAIRASYGA